MNCKVENLELEDCENNEQQEKLNNKYLDNTVYYNRILGKDIRIKIVRVINNLFFFVYHNEKLVQKIPISWDDHKYVYPLFGFMYAHYIICDPETDEVLVVRSYGRENLRYEGIINEDNYEKNIDEEQYEKKYERYFKNKYKRRKK